MPRDPSNLTGVSRDAERQLLQFFNGTFLETFDALVTSDGATVTMTLEQAGGGDLTAVFNDGQTAIDTTPAISIALTAGTDIAPQRNYIYILQTAPGTLVKSTSAWPSAEHCKVSFFFVPSASLVNTGAAGNNFLHINQNWNDHAADTVGQGHLSHIVARIRGEGEGAKWKSGCEGVATQDGNDLWVSVAAGLVSQIHPHTFAALDSDTAGAGDAICVVNDPDAAYVQINSLNEITKHSNGDAIGVNKFVKFILWAVANKSGEVSPMYINLPAEEYPTADTASRDVDGEANFSIPIEFQIESSTGFLVAAFICKHTAAAMEIQSTDDLRGQTPANASGSGTGGGDVTAAAVLTNNAVVLGDGGGKGVKTITTGTDGYALIADSGEGDGHKYVPRRVVKAFEIHSPAVNDEFRFPFIFEPVSVVEVGGETDAGTADFNLEIRAFGSAFAAGTDVLTADLQADVGGETTTTFDNSGDVAARKWLVIKVSAVAANPAILIGYIVYDIDA